MTFPHHGEGSDVQGSVSTQSTDSGQQVADALAAAQPTDDSGTDPVSQQAVQQTQQQNAAPWADYIKDLPDSVVPLVEPIFKKWDADVTQRFQGLHSEYEPYKPLVDAYESDYLQNAVQMLEALETNPQGFYQALQQSYNFGNEQGTAGQQGAGPVDYGQQQQQQQFSNPVTQDDFQQQPDPFANHPLAQQIQQQDQLLRVIAEREIQRQEEAQAAQDAQALEQALTDLHTQHGNFDENYVLALAAQGVPLDEAVQTWQQALQQHMQQVNAPNNNAPVVVGAGGGYPTQQVDTTNLTDKQRKDLVVQMLAANADQNG